MAQWHPGRAVAMRGASHDARQRVTFRVWLTQAYDMAYPCASAWTGAGPEHERRKPVPCPCQLGQVRPSIHALDSLGQTGQDRVYIPLSVMSGNVRPDKTPQRSLISLRFFLSDRTNQRKNRTNGHVRPCPGDGAKKHFRGGGRNPHPPPCPSTIPKSHKDIFMFNPHFGLL